MKICICDSVDESRLRKGKIIADYFAEKNNSCEVLLFESSEDLIVSENLAKTDIFLIDTCLGDTDGMRSLRELKEMYRNKVFIVTSDSYECLDEAMDLGVIRYILNGTEKENYYSALDKALEDIESFVVRVKGRNGNEYYLHKSDIVYVEAKARRVFVFTTSGKIETNMNITAMRVMLNTPNFISPHYSFVVNSNYISHIEGRDVFLKVNIISESR